MATAFLMLVLVIPQIETSVLLFLIWDFMLFLVLLGLFSNEKCHTIIYECKRNG